MSKARMKMHERAVVTSRNARQLVREAIACASDEDLTADEFMALYINISKRYRVVTAAGDHCDDVDDRILCIVG